MTKKRHHFIPKSYLNSFCDDEGMLYIYRKDDPEREIRQSPNNTGFHKYFYSQPLPDSGVDHDNLENLFGKYESRWPEIVEKLRSGKNANSHVEDIYAFIGLQRARVPAARDACEKLLAETVKATMRRMADSGDLPPLPKGFENILDHVDVAIDPHQSLHAMVHTINGTGILLKQIGIGVLHNNTGVPFLTSDNPVIWFDPSLQDNKTRPYSVRKNGPIILLFPVAADTMIYGDSTMQEQFTRHGLLYTEPKNVEAVETMNQYICRFAYETVFADRSGFKELVKQYADVSPILRTETIPAPDGQFLVHQFVWGKRSSKPKWEPRNR